jgi:hypothetical protein
MGPGQSCSEIKKNKAFKMGRESLTQRAFVKFLMKSLRGFFLSRKKN